MLVIIKKNGGWGDLSILPSGSFRESTPYLPVQGRVVVVTLPSSSPDIGNTYHSTLLLGDVVRWRILPSPVLATQRIKLVDMTSGKTTRQRSTFPYIFQFSCETNVYTLPPGLSPAPTVYDILPPSSLILLTPTVSLPRSFYWRQKYLWRPLLLPLFPMGCFPRGQF